MCLWGPACNGYIYPKYFVAHLQLRSHDIYLIKIIPNIATDRTKPIACGYRQ